MVSQMVESREQVHADRHLDPIKKDNCIERRIADFLRKSNIRGSIQQRMVFEAAFNATRRFST